MDQLVVADSYFASVQSAIELKKHGLRFIGVVKTAVKQFPMSHLANVQLLGSKGDRHGLLSLDKETGTQLCAFVWLDRERRYFIATTSSLAEGSPVVWHQYCQIAIVETNKEPEKQEVVIAQPKAAEEYYAANDKIDQHNRFWQDDLMMERKLRTMDWDVQVNQTLLGMCMVDSYLLAQGCWDRKVELRDFYTSLAEQLINNEYGRMRLQGQGSKRTQAELLSENQRNFGGAIPPKL